MTQSVMSMDVVGMPTGHRRDGRDRRIELMQQGIMDLRLFQERAENMIVLNEIFRPYGAEVLGYMGPAKFSLMRHIRCEICEERVYTMQHAYELRLLSQAWGPRYGYMHRGCFDQATGMNDEVPIAPLEGDAGARA